MAEQTRGGAQGWLDFCFVILLVSALIQDPTTPVEWPFPLPAVNPASLLCADRQDIVTRLDGQTFPWHVAAFQRATTRDPQVLDCMSTAFR